MMSTVLLALNTPNTHDNISFSGNLAAAGAADDIRSQLSSRSRGRPKSKFQHSFPTKTWRCSTQAPHKSRQPPPPKDAALDHARRRRSPGSKMVPTKELITRGIVNGHHSKLPERKVAAKRTVTQEEEGKVKVLSADQSFSWAKDSYNSWQRSVDIWAFLLTLRIRIIYDNDEWTYFGGFTQEKQKTRRNETARWLREQALQLGPTFIKFGQFFSTRSDLLPKEYVNELAKLQDKVPAFSHEKARDYIERELGAPIQALFRDFEDRPIAAASLGQVHRAVLHNGEKVAVKVQRPGLRKLFNIDLRNMKLLAEYFQRHEKFGGSKRDWISIYDDCARLLYQEIDYVNEGKSADRFRRDFRNVKWVRVPIVHWDYTSTRVLTLEYLPGIKISDLDSLDAKGFSRSRIASSAIESYLIQILKTGFVHADPHPGNLAVYTDGSLVYYDFGMMGEIKSFTRERLLELFFALYEKDVKKVARSLVSLEIVQPTGDMISVQRSIQFFLNKLMSQTADRHQTMAAVGEELFATARDQPISFPSTFVFIMKAFTTIEGIGYSLDPQFSFAKCATPYVQELLMTRQRHLGGAELVDDIRKLDDARSHALSMPSRIQQIEDFTKQLESGDLKLRVRVLESEKAAQKASLLQIATIYIVLGGILLNTGITLSSQGIETMANGSFIGSGIFLIMSIRSMKRVQKLDDLMMH